MKNTNLIETVFSKNWHFESSILCTYGLNLNFFENYLMKLDALYSCDNICIFTDSGTYDNFLRESYSPRWLNKKYLINRLKTGGVFHPKLYMFASEEKAILGIGSANLTRDGIASNLELLSTFEISGKNLACASLLRDCIEYARRLAQISKSKKAVDQVDVFNQLCKAYYFSDEENGIRFVHNLDRPLIEVIKESAKGSKILKIQIISPFYDAKLTPLGTLRDAFPDSTFEIYLQQKKTNFPKEMFAALKSQTSLLLYKNIERYMHGKAILLHSNDAILIFFGSANFTRSALNEVPPTGNYEIGLLGQIDRKTAGGLLCPTGKKATKIKKNEDIEISPGSEYEARPASIEYITEVVLKNNIIKVAVNPDIPLEAFSPTKFKLRDFNDNVHEGNIDKDLAVEVTPGIKKKVPGKMAVQILGQDEKGNTLESNLLWVIELEEKSGDPLRRRSRRVYNDPFELISILYEILETGDEEDLRLFLLLFDIPLDVVLPPRNDPRPPSLDTKGNVEGVLPTHHSYIFSASIKEAYADCLNRLYRKLECHAKNPQINKINNFVMILQSLYSLIWFINSESIYEKHKSSSVIMSDTWALIRDYYDMLLKYVNYSWELLWSNGGYRDAINAKIAKDRTDDQQNDFSSFEQYLADNHNYTFDELIRFALQTVDHFEELKRVLLVNTGRGGEVKPLVFPTKHKYLQPKALNKIREAIKQLDEIFRNAECK